MQTAILRSLASVCAEGCVVEPGPGGPEPSSFMHFAWAALNAGDAGSTPGLAWKRSPRPGLGSGKLGTPLARMHRANASPGEEAEPPGAGVLEVAVPVAPAATVDADVVPPAGVDVVWFEALPPQPATSRPLRSAAPAAPGLALDG